MAIRCENCGHDAPTDDRFCSKCGAPLPVEPSPEEAAPDPEDSSWVTLAGEPAPPEPAPPEPTSAQPPIEPEPQAEPAAESIAAATIPPPSHEPVTSYDDPTPPPPKRDKGLWIAVVAVGIVGALALVVWTMNWAGTNDDRIEIAEESDDPSAPGLDEWQTGYTDIFLSAEDITLVTGAEARQRDFPTTEGTSVQRTLPANTSVTGRWVRGRDPTTKWLKLAGGGYIWEGNLAQPGGEGSPIEIALNNRRANFGPDIESYLNRARSQQRAKHERLARMSEKELQTDEASELEMGSSFEPVPNRRWRGLTVTSAAQLYEGHGITFREDEATVRRALAAAGVRVDSDGTIPLADEQAITCGLASTADWPEARRYGATSLTCGV